MSADMGLVSPGSAKSLLTSHHWPAEKPTWNAIIYARPFAKAMRGCRDEG